MKLLRTTELAARYGVTPDTLRDWARRGLIASPLRINARTLRWQPTDLQASLTKNAGGAR